MEKPLTLQEFARMGGNALKAKKGEAYMKALCKKALKKRWDNYREKKALGLLP